MSRIPPALDSSLLRRSRNQLSPAAPDGKTAGEIASERDIKKEPAKSLLLQHSCPSSSSSPVDSPTLEQSTNLNILTAEADKLIEDVLTYQHTDFEYVFNQPNSDIAEISAFTRSFPGSSGDFISFSEYYYTHYKGFKLSITFDPAFKQITISPRFPMGRTALHQSVACWGNYVLHSMVQGPKPFVSIEELLLLQLGEYTVQLGKNTRAEGAEGKNTGKKEADKYKVPDQSYRVEGMRYPCVVFETGWTESMEDLERDARQWLTRTRQSVAMGGAKTAVDAVESVRVVILTKIWEVKGEELKEREKQRRKALDDHDAILDEEDLDLLTSPPSATINVDSWIGAIHCDLHVWRWNNRTNAPACVSRHVVLPCSKDGQNENSGQFALWKRDILPQALDGEKKFAPDLNKLRKYLDKARKEYGDQRFSDWKDTYLERRHGRV